MNERELLIAFKAKKKELDAMKEAIKEVQKEYDSAEFALIEHMQESGADSTAEYQDIGYGRMSKPRVYASCNKENEAKLKEYLIAKGRGDIIKNAVSPAALSSYIGELLESGKPVPEFIGYYLKTSVRIY